MDERLRAVAVEQGVFLRREALEAGYDDNAIARRVRSGVWHRVRHGAYTYSDVWAPLSPEDRHRIATRAVLRVARSPVVVSHVSAALEHGATLWDLSLDAVHLTRLDRRAGRQEAGVHQHRGRLDPADVVDTNRLMVTSPTRTALDIITTTDVEHGLVVVNDFLHRGLTSPERLRDALRDRRRWPHSLHTDLTLRLADGRIESVGESRTMFLCWSQRLPRPLPQVKIVDPTGRTVAVVDMAWPDEGVFLEFDGRVKYAPDVANGLEPADVVFREKQREDLIRRLTGWSCIRLVWADLHRPERTAAMIRAHLTSSRRVFPA